jgi:hypothetical protein
MRMTKSSLKTVRAWAIKEAASKIWTYVRLEWVEKSWKELSAWIARCRSEPMKKVGQRFRPDANSSQGMLFFRREVGNDKKTGHIRVRV